MKKVFLAIMLLLTMAGCEKSDRVNYNIRREANNFNIYRRVVAINTRLNRRFYYQI